ncbi:MAG: glycoside hydrolase family 88 protein [Verrucomicrobiales bacterium]|nr:glycoside hydrolase family 88 protein [Verrucomicrobiales bacterium]
MPLKIDARLTPSQLVPAIERVFELSAAKIHDLEKRWDPARGTPVFTVRGRYTSRGWTEWTQGFQFGSALLQFDATGDSEFLEMGRRGTIERMATHVSHVGVHDHGFNNLSTYGNLLRLMGEGRIAEDPREREFLELALKVSGAVQAARWTPLSDGTGFIHSFNGPHSLFVDTMRSLRSLAVAHQLGHCLMGEQDARISLLQRLEEHAVNTARYNIYYGEGRDAYDVRGRTAHEAIFNIASGVFRCPNSQQGYSPFSTWTRGLAWAILGFAEQLEFRAACLPRPRGADTVSSLFRKAASATAEFYLQHCCADGIPMWDTGAPQLHRLGEYLGKASDPFNPHEPVDSSAAAIAAQGFIRLADVISGNAGARYRQAGFTIARTLFKEPYLSESSRHQGLLLHSVYHRPNGWDHITAGQEVPNGESSMWGDYHARELALLILRQAKNQQPLAFYGCAPGRRHAN